MGMLTASFAGGEGVTITELSQNFRDGAMVVLVPAHSIGNMVSPCLIVNTEDRFQSLWS